MSDLGENLPVSEKTSYQDIPQWRNEPAEKRALDLAWAKGITGKSVHFPQKDGTLVWGIEYCIPLRFEEVKGQYTDLVKKIIKEREDVLVNDEQLKQGINEKRGATWFKDKNFELPERIKKIRIIDMAPQESLFITKRNVKSKRMPWHGPTITEKLTKPVISVPKSGELDTPSPEQVATERLQTLQDILYEIFGDEREKFEQFKKAVDDKGVEEILLISAHGGEDNIIGEQGKTKKSAVGFQAEGNRIDINDVIARYDGTKDVKVILINTCYLGDDKLSSPGYKSMIFRLKGMGGTSHPERDPLSLFRPKNKVLVSEPAGK